MFMYMRARVPTNLFAVFSNTGRINLQRGATPLRKEQGQIIFFGSLEKRFC
jgi:hypothetical protein